MQKLPEAADRKRGKEETLWAKKAYSLSAVTSGVTTPKSFLLLVEGPWKKSCKN